MPNCIQPLLQSRGLLASLVVATGLLAAGCAVNTPGAVGTATTSSVKAEDAVKSRAQKRIDLLMANNYEGAYAYLTPSYRALNNTESYRNRFGSGAKWVNPQVHSVKCEDAERCKVTVTLGVLVVAPGFGTKPIDSTMFETWLLEDGQWWYYQGD